MALRIALAVALAIPCAALAQTASVEDVGPRPTQIAVPNATVAGGEEPGAIQVNPAAPGFVAAPSFQYFHEGQRSGGRLADAAFLTLPLGGLVPTFAFDWMRPGDAPRFRRFTLGVAASDHRVFSVGGAWTWVYSPDRELDRLDSYALGATFRPARWLSLGASLDGAGASLAGQRLPARWDVGAAVRGWHDRLTLSVDLLASDRATGLGDFDPRAVSFGVSAEVAYGIALFGQLQTPLHSGGDTFGLFGLAWNTAHAGVVSSASAGGPVHDRWLVGFRASAESYLAPPGRPRAVRLDLADELSPPRSLFFGGGRRDPYGRLVARLAEIRDDASAAALVVEVDDLPVGWARAGELRDALAEVAAKKPVVAFVSGGGLREYWIASAAQEVYLPPAGTLEIGGLSSSTPFLRDGLAKIGVAVEVVAAGRYKNAPDPLVRQQMSEAQREAQDAVLDDTFDRVVTDLSHARGLGEPRVRELVDQAVLTSIEAKDTQLADGVCWPDELEQIASERAGRRLRLGEYRHPKAREAQRWGPRPVIAVVPIQGAIVSGRNRGGPATGRLAGADSIGREIRRAAEDRRVKAIVLRIDSPGGDALASDLLWREVAQARKKKPVIASLGDVAASGGYLVAVAAGDLVAEPSTLTGSIGVFALKPDLSGLLAKLGVNVVTLRRGAKADFGSPTRAWTPEERALLERQIQAFYAGFKARVAEGRRLSPEQVEQVAQGRVWTGAQAKTRGLVDQLGTLADAVSLASQRAGLTPADDPEVLRFEPPRRLLEELSELVSPDELSLVERVATAVPEVRTAAVLMEMGEQVALPVEWLGPEPRER